MLRGLCYSRALIPFAVDDLGALRKLQRRPLNSAPTGSDRMLSKTPRSSLDKRLLESIATPGCVNFGSAESVPFTRERS